MDLEKLKRKHKKKIENFKKVTAVNPKKLDAELAMNSGRMFTANQRLADAELVAKKCKLMVKQVRAKAKVKWSKKTIEGKKLSIPLLEAKVDDDEEVIQAEHDLIEDEYVVSLCGGGAKSIKEKGENIRTLAYGRGAEMKHNYVKEAKEERVNKKTKRQ